MIETKGKVLQSIKGNPQLEGEIAYCALCPAEMISHSRFYFYLTPSKNIVLICGRCGEEGEVIG